MIVWNAVLKIEFEEATNQVLILYSQSFGLPLILLCNMAQLFIHTKVRLLKNRLTLTQDYMSTEVFMFLV